MPDDVLHQALYIFNVLFETGFKMQPIKLHLERLWQ